MLNGYKTLIGAAIALLAEGARLAGFNLEVDPAGLANGIVAMVGAVLAIYGRIVATKRIPGGEALQ